MLFILPRELILSSTFLIFLYFTLPLFFPFLSITGFVEVDDKC